MKITVFIPSKSSSDPLITEGLAYLQRLRHPYVATAVFLSPKSDIAEDQKEKRMLLEGHALLAKSEGYYRIALAETGKIYSSSAFAGFLEKLQLQPKKIAFLIGGAFGLSAEVIKSVDATLSLSAMTMPHRMAFLLLSEQIYRAQEIMRGTLYHK